MIVLALAFACGIAITDDRWLWWRARPDETCHIQDADQANGLYCRPNEMPNGTFTACPLPARTLGQPHSD